MVAYVIFIRESVTDPAAVARYGAEAVKTLDQHAITLLTRFDPHEVWEGNPCAGVLLMQFPNGEAARRWYFSPEYQAAKAHRLGAGDFRVIFTEPAEPTA